MPCGLIVTMVAEGERAKQRSTVVRGTGSCRRVPRRGVRGRGTRVPGDRARAGARRARQRGAGRDVGALARGGRGRRVSASPRRRSTRRFPPPAPESDGVPSVGRRGAGAGADARARAVRRRRQRHPHPGAALAAERAGLRRATLIPHVYPVHEAGMPLFAFGALPPRTPVGRGAVASGAAADARAGLRRGRDEHEPRRGRRSGWRRPNGSTAGISDALAIVATFPQLEYPRAWPAARHVIGPMRVRDPVSRGGPAGGRGAARARSAEHGAGPGAAAGAGGARGARRRAGARAGDDEPADSAATGRSRRRQTPRSSTGLSYTQALRGRGPRDLPRRPRHGGTGARRRRARALLPRGRRHGGERRPGCLGRRRADVAVAADGPGVVAGHGEAGAQRPRLRSTGARDRPLGRGKRRGARAAEFVERLAA